MTWAGPLTKPQPRFYAREAQRVKDDAARKAVYRAVSLRDGYSCRACGVRLRQTPSAVPERLEHHHIQPRSLGGKDTTANLLLLCLACHTDRHVTRDLEISGDADGLVLFRQGVRAWQG